MRQKTTSVIKDEIIMQVKEAVKEGRYKSMADFVENAIKNKLEDINPVFAVQSTPDFQQAPHTL